MNYPVSTAGEWGVLGKVAGDRAGMSLVSGDILSRTPPSPTYLWGVELWTQIAGQKH